MKNIGKICFDHPDKKRYNTQKDAETIILMFNNKELRTYFCASCEGWHLTSKNANSFYISK